MNQLVLKEIRKLAREALSDGEDREFTIEIHFNFRSLNGREDMAKEAVQARKSPGRRGTKRLSGNKSLSQHHAASGM